MLEVVLAAARALFLFSPLLAASALSGIVLRFDLCPKLRRPIDAGKTLGGRRVFGDSKTWRGVAVAVVGCIATITVQKHLLHIPAWLTVVHYESTNEFLFGAAMGTSAMLGELPNSFVKRRLGIEPGRTTRGPLVVLFYLWDQIDLLTTAWPVVLIWVRPGALVVVMSFAVTLALHPLVSLVGYLIGARKTVR